MSQQGLSPKMSHYFHTQDMALLKYVGSTVKKHRIHNNLDITDLSAICGIRKDTISDIEEGTTDIYLNDLSSIAAALGISAIDLVDIPSE